MQDPTPKQYNAFQGLFDYFDTALFGSDLPPVILTFTRKDPRLCGYHAADRWEGPEGQKISEIALNPSYISEAGFLELCQTLVHEMCHLWQYAYGTPSRNGYHNKEWGKKMQEVGLMPSNTGEPGGKTTGQQMADYPIEGGPFLAAFEQITDKRKFPYSAAEVFAQVPTTILQGIAAGEENQPAPSPVPTKSKVKHSCPQCNANAWGKPSLNLICGECMVRYKIIG